MAKADDGVDVAGRHIVGDTIVRDANKNLFATWLHDLNQRLAIRRQAMAMGHGVDPAPYAAVFPGSNTTNTNVSSGLKALPALALGLSTLLGGAGLGAGLCSLFKPAVSAAAPAAPQAIPLSKYQFRVVPD